MWQKKQLTLHVLLREILRLVVSRPKESLTVPTKDRGSHKTFVIYLFTLRSSTQEVQEVALTHSARDCSRGLERPMD